MQLKKNEVGQMRFYVSTPLKIISNLKNILRVKCKLITNISNALFNAKYQLFCIDMILFQKEWV